MKRRASLTVLGVLIGGYGAVGALNSIGCNTVGNVVPVDASDERVAPDAPQISCASDPPPVMQYLDPQGNLQNGDWSCYAPDAAFYDPFAGDADNDAAGDANDAGSDDGGDTDGGAPADAAADAGPPADGGSGADGGSPVDASGPLSTFTLKDFVTLQPVGGGSVDLFYGNDTTKTPDFSGKTSEGDSGVPYGSFFFPTGPQDTLYAFRVNGGAQSDPTGSSSLLNLVWYDNIAPATNGTLVGECVSQGTVETLASGLATIEPGTMIITTAVRDCQDRDVQGGFIDLVDNATGLAVTSGQSATSIHVAYFNVGPLPDTACTHTIAQPSLWVAVNVPVTGSYTLRSRGRMSASDLEPTTLGERAVPAFANEVVIVRPYRIASQ